MIARRNLAAALVSSLVGGACAAVAGLADGEHAALSALLGLGLVLGFLPAGTIPFVLAGDTKDGKGSFAFLVLAMNYALRLVLALVVLKLAARSDWVVGRSVGLTVIACTAAWTATHVYFGLARKHQPTLEL